MKLAGYITAYLFIGFLLMGMYTADYMRKCDMDMAPDVVIVGALGWLPMAIGYRLNSKGLQSWDEMKCPKGTEH